MSFDLTVYLNLDSRFFEFKPGDMLRPTDRLAKVICLPNLPDKLLLNVDDTLEMVFGQLNMPEPEQHWAKVYRMAGNRSLSVGDVVQLGEAAYAVANAGFKPVSITAEQVVTKRPADLKLSLPQDEALS